MHKPLRNCKLAFWKVAYIKIIASFEPKIVGSLNPSKNAQGPTHSIPVYVFLCYCYFIVARVAVFISFCVDNYRGQAQQSLDVAGKNYIVASHLQFL